MSSILPQLVSSPACLPKMGYEEVLATYQKLGFSKFEAFSEWAASRLDWNQNPNLASEKAREFGFSITSFHLPGIQKDDPETGLQNAVKAARYAQNLGARVVLFKAVDKELFSLVGKRFLDALETENISVTPVVQNHKGTAITTLEDYEEVFDRLDGDRRMKAVLEVGHFARVGTSWQDGWDLLGERVALIHVNEIRDGQSVLYGTGEVDFRGLLEAVKSKNYNGEIVVELELPNRETEIEPTLRGLEQAQEYLESLYQAV